MLNYTYFDASEQEKHDGVKIAFLSFLNQNVFGIDEHFRDATNRSQQTPLEDHMIQCHPSESEPQLSVAILRHCKDRADRKIAEALVIRDHLPKLNTQMDTWPVLSALSPVRI